MSSNENFDDISIDIDGKNNTIYDDIIFTKKLFFGNQVKEVAFSAVEDPDKLGHARDLINDRYGGRGYGSAHVIPSGAHHTTFTAEVDETVVGTMTLAIDSEFGLNIDHTFGVEVSQIRQMKGSKICELTRLAFDSGVRSKETLAGLFHFAFIYGTMISECTDLLIEVNPRHAGFYKKMLDFERIGALKTNDSVDAPSQLMNLKVDAIRRSILCLAGRAPPDAARSLYSKFFPPLQEAQIRCLLLSKKTLRYVRHDSLYSGRSLPEFTNEAAMPPVVHGPPSEPPPAAASSY